MHYFHNPSRRQLLQTAAAALASLILPQGLFAGKPDKPFWFIHTETGESWPVADPVPWSLENADQPTLQRAREGLLKLTTSDGERIIRLVTRRCKLNLLEVHSKQIVVHHWGTQGRADLRPFFKTHRLARKDITVVVSERKKEVSTTQPGDDFLFGNRLATDFPLDLYISKWRRSFEQEPDDWSAAPGTSSGFAWEGVEDNLICWAALKSAWRRSPPLLCLNCDRPTLLTNFGNPWVGMLHRSPKFVHVCENCGRSFRDESVKDIARWMAQDLDAEVRPTYEMVWNRRVKCEPWIRDTIPL